MAKYIVLGSKSYDFTDEKTGERKIGSTLHYIDEPFEDGKIRGYIPFTLSVGLDILDSIEVFPAVCDIEFKRVPNAKGKAIEVFSSLKFVNPARIVFD